MFRYQKPLKSQKAFTILELMVVVVIISILSLIAYPSYIDSVRKARRADAKGALMSFANAMERNFTENNTYCDVGGVGGGSTCGGAANDDGTPNPTFFSATSPLDGGTPYYNLTLVVGSVTQTTYTLQATAIGDQVGDGNLQINNTETRGRRDVDADGTYDGSWDQ